MFQLFIEGGWLFMSLISLLALTMLYFAVKGAAAVYGHAAPYTPGSLYYIRFFGMLALVTGVLGQLIGLYDAMKYIAQAGEVSQQVLTGGLKVSSITTLYGFIVFILAHLIWFVLDIKGKSSTVRT